MVGHGWVPRVSPKWAPSAPLLRVTGGAKTSTSQCKLRKGHDGIRNYDAYRVDFSASILDTIALFTHGKCGAAHINVDRSTFYFVLIHSIPCGPVYIVTLVRGLLDRPTFHIAFTHSCLGRSTYLPITRVEAITTDSFGFFADFRNSCDKSLSLRIQGTEQR